MQNLFIEFLPPWVETGLQPAFYDKESGTVLQQTARMYAKINDLIKSNNKLVSDFTILYNYVHDYFDNLDIQEEVNNKLDEMAESGELAEIIAQYIQLNGVLAFDTIDDMADAENLVEGSIARVLGNSSYSAGDGAYYRVRALVNTDVIDGVNLVAITNAPTLVAERITDASVNNLQSQIDNIVTPPKKYLFVGDSYADGYSPDGDTTPWQNIVKTKLGLTDAQFVTTHAGGYGFGTSAEYNYYGLINALADDNDITDIIIGGGYNDNTSTEQNIIDGIANVVTLCATKFPNAKLHIAFFGWSRNASAKTNLVFTYYQYNKGCDAQPSVDFMKNTQYALHDYYALFSSDGIHPNQDGQNAIANVVYDALVYGSANVMIYSGFTFSTSAGVSGGSWNTFLNNDVTTLWTSGLIQLSYSSNYPELDAQNDLELGTINGGAIVGTTGDGLSKSFPVVLQIDTATTTAPHAGEYVTVPVMLKIQSGKLYLQGSVVNTAGNNYGKYVIKAIQFPTISMSTNSMLA